MGQGKFTPKSFRYDRCRDQYICPEGHKLTPYEKMDHGHIKRYRITGGHCRKCAQQSDCLPDTQKHRARFVYRSPHQSEIDQVRKRQQTQAFIAKMIHRKWAIVRTVCRSKTISRDASCPLPWFDQCIHSSPDDRAGTKYQAGC